ncbi:connector enhancer of kinase suppressor of ras 1 isoform X1 [Tympanuchus pallidicinctus]|uniref:connector enhancer of kinase suppressor of ras 1 isoform X1 n=1 Tax=Tympanuchus pallidicinctus TaxID=109042 RepID=UPI002286F4CA|nr:connector enhancer of kinase suppressor of ras 1 isoform X1 [Tympanuchus pallidicinctus]
MEPVGAWGPAQTAAWLRGLDAAVQGYPFEEWGLEGTELLRLSEGALEALGVWRVGHQELLLEAVEQLRALDTELVSTSLRTLTERLRELAQCTETVVLEGSPGGTTPQPPLIALLTCVVDLIGAAKRLFSWLNRYLFSTLNDFSSTRDIVLLCARLVEVLQMDCSTAEKNSQILCICQHIVGICESIVGCSPPALLDRRAMLQHVELALPLTPCDGPPDSPSTPTLPPGLWGSPPTSPSIPVLPPETPGSPPASPSTPMLPYNPLGLEITSTSSCLHFVSMTNSEALAVHGGHILPGDEIVQVDEQVVVGWTRINLVKKLLEKDSRASLVLKKLPLSLPGSPLSTRQQVPGAFLDAVDLPKSSECPSSPSSPASSTTADADSGPDPSTDEDKHSTGLRREDVGELRPAALSLGAGKDVVWEASTPQGTPSSPCAFQPCTAEFSPTTAPRTQSAEPSQTPREDSPETGRRAKAPQNAAGVATRLSRRRVSCRDLGRADCDGWLLKKKDHVGFMAQKWKRCWFVLKGHTLYWYNHPNDDKAAGLINVATYNLESTREQKKKYVFQLSHEKYKPFVFAAETLADLSMWVSHLITAKTKHALAHQPVPHKEEDCYSETEAEDLDDESPRPGFDSPKKRLQNAPEKAQLFQTSGESSSAQSSPQPHSPVEPCEEDLESLMWCLRQGGVSLIGRQRFLTQEQCRKSFIRRNKNPRINEKVHAVRALQSTLKAKLAELQALEQLLDDAALTSEKFQRWKEEHQDLYQELQEWWARQQGQDSGGGHEAEQRPPAGAAEP